MKRRTFLPGEYVYRVEQPSDSIFLLRSGQVELTTPYPETGEGVDSSIGPGYVFGEVEMIDGRSRVSNARASESSVIVEISRDELMEILYLKPEKSLILGKSTYDRLKCLFDEDSLDSELAKLREEMLVNVRNAVVAHESRVVKSHNGMAAIAFPIIIMIVLAVGAYWYFHRV
jgi:CRP-like cAMP-binding protein